MTLGQRISTYRKQLGISQEALGALRGCHQRQSAQRGPHAALRELQADLSQNQGPAGWGESSVLPPF